MSRQLGFGKIFPVLFVGVLILTVGVFAQKFDMAGASAKSTLLGGSEITEHFDDSSLMLEATAPEQSVKKIAVILFNFQNDQSQPYTPAYAKSMVFESINSYFRENSFNRFSLAGAIDPQGDVFGWYTIPYSNTACSYDAWSNAALDKVRASGVDTSRYDHIIFAFPRTSACSWTGLSQTGGLKSWNNGRMTVGIAAHELGHNFGLVHANTYRCFSGTERVAISSDCKTYEYTDPYDIMGSGTFSTNYAAHINAFYKKSLGWLDDSDTITVSQSGLYTIKPVETAGGVQLVRIPRGTGADGKMYYYYLEFRQPIGFDNYWRFSSSSPATNGVTIRLAPEYSKSASTMLVDTTPETLSFEDAPLLVGKVFTDREKGISISAVSISEGAISVYVTMPTAATAPVAPACVRRVPTISLTPSPLQNSAQKFTIKVTNNDDTACGPSTFNVVPTLPSTLVQTPRWVSISSLHPGTFAKFSVSVSGPPSAVGAQISQIVTNTNAQSYTATATTRFG